MSALGERLRYRRARQRYRQHPFPEPALEQLLDTPLTDPKRRWHEGSWLAIDLETTGLEPDRDYIISIGSVAIERGRIRLDTARHQLIDSRNLVGDSATIHHLRDADLSEGVPLAVALLTLARDLTGRYALVHHRPMDEGFLHAAYREQFGVDWVHPLADTLALEKRRLMRRNTSLPEGSFRLGECRRRYGLPEYPAHNALQDAIACAEVFMAWAQHHERQGPTIRQCLRLSR